MNENKLQRQALFGAMTPEDWENFYALSENKQDVFCRERLRTFGLSRSYERNSYDFQYRSGDAPAFHQLCLLTENQEKFPLKVADVLEFHVEHIEPCLRFGHEVTMYHGVYLRIRKSADKKLKYPYSIAHDIRERLFERLIGGNDIYSIAMDQGSFCDVTFPECIWAAEAFGCSVAEDMNGGQLTFLDNDGIMARLSRQKSDNFIMNQAAAFAASSNMAGKYASAGGMFPIAEWQRA